MSSRAACLRRAHPPVVTVALIAAVMTTSWRSGSLHGELPLITAFRYGFSGRGLLMGHWSTVATSQFLTRDLFMTVSICLSLAVMLGGYEILAGSRRAALVAGVCGAAGPLLVGGLVSLGSAAGLSFAGRVLSTLDYGASAITAGGGGALVGLIRRRWLTLAAVAFVLGGLALHHQMADWEHLISFPVGYGLSRWLGRPRVGARRTTTRLWMNLTGVISAIGLAGASVAGASVAAATVEVQAQSPVGALLAPPRQATSAPLGSPDPAPRSAPSLPPAPPSPATLLEVRYPTPSLGGDRRLLILLPAGYRENPNLRYPVVELLHGDPGAPEDVITGLNLPDLVARASDLGPFIAVAPDGHGPVVEVGDWADTSQQQLGTAASDDLQTWVENHLRSDGRWGVMGLSSGGYGAAYLGMRKPDIYDRVCVMSGFFVARSPAFAHESADVRSHASPLLQATASGPRTLLLVGSQDSEYVRDASQYFKALQTAGQSADLQMIPGVHEWQLWKSATPGCVRFLLAAPLRHVPTNIR